MEEGRGLTIRPIARIHSELGSKFGAPRQSGVVPELRAEVVFEEEFRREEAVRGLEGFSHIWLIWEFSENRRRDWSPTVRPPRLGGNTRLGVFATRSPVRPNPLGLSCVRLEAVEPGPSCASPGPTWWTGRPSTTSSPTCPTRTRTRRRAAASPPPTGSGGWRWTYPPPGGGAAGGKAARPARRAGAGPAPGLSGLGGPGIRHVLRRVRGEVHRLRRRAQGAVRREGRKMTARRKRARPGNRAGFLQLGQAIRRKPPGSSSAPGPPRRGRRWPWGPARRRSGRQSRRGRRPS